jgi:hypothetical protein
METTMAIPLFVVWMKGVFTDKMPMGKSNCKY